MSRFGYLDCDYDENTITWEMWNHTVSLALGSSRGQAALAEMEEALRALPEPRLIEGVLAKDDGVCAMGALVAHKKAKAEGLEMAEAIGVLSAEVKPLLEDYEYDPTMTADAGTNVGLSFSVAWHLAYLNDEKFRDATPGERYRLMLMWVRRAQGKAGP